jgi:hypothetical protein
MMTDLTQETLLAPRHSLWTNRWLRFAAIVVVSGIGGYFVGGLLSDSRILDPYVPAIDEWYAAQGPIGFACALTAFMLALVAVAMAVHSLFPESLRRALKAGPEEDMRRPLATQRIGAISAMALAMLLGVFIIPGLNAAYGIGITLVAWAVLLWASAALLKVGDELYAHVQMESWAWEGVLTQIAIGCWAALAWFDLVPALDPRGVLLAIVLAGLMTSTVVVVRRGMVAE